MRPKSSNVLGKIKFSEIFLEKRRIKLDMPKISPASFRQRVYNLGQRAAQKTVAYFCMEYGLKTNLPIYSGGLGVLAGDTVKSAADLGLPMIALGLLYRDGYFHQSITNGRQMHAAQSWDPNQYPGLIDLKDSVVIPIAGQQVQFRLWGYEVKGYGGQIVPLILLDSLGANNIPGYDTITSQLYKAGSRERLLQDMALGIGGVEVLKWC
ncbi:MAG: glycogen/starch/alpha-glucan phosphorylase, partial [Candidatus Margulisbacteria bacterium]|nr:glycogen/starch/alpha-glucan phosphorylase [Candidatus Margulisiibacteriota bacterium]